MNAAVQSETHTFEDQLRKTSSVIEGMPAVDRFDVQRATEAIREQVGLHEALEGEMALSVLLLEKLAAREAEKN